MKIGTKIRQRFLLYIPALVILLAISANGMPKINAQIAPTTATLPLTLTGQIGPQFAVMQANSEGKGAGNTTQESILVNGVTRTYVLHMPRRYEQGESALLIALHGRGGGGPGTKMEQDTKLDEKADREGFAIAYLDGLPDATGTLNWNYFYDPFFVGTTPPDDVGFVREVIDSLKARIHPDHRRIYVTGTSAGGFMAQTVGVALSDRVAAVGVVQGGISVIFPGTPQAVPHATAPVSVLLLKGDQDAANFYCGALFQQFDLVEASSDQDFDYWAGSSANECSHVHPTGPLCENMGIVDPQGNVTLGTPTSLTKKEATACKEDTEVKLYRLIGGVDHWNLNPMNVPGQIPFSPDLNDRTGVTTNDILWKFFEEHPKHNNHGEEP